MKFFVLALIFLPVHFSLGGYLFPDGPDQIDDHVYIAFTPNLYEAHFLKINFFNKLHNIENFDQNKDTVIYIPGFGNTGVKDLSVTAIRSAFRERGDHNIIAIDWTHYARKTFYATLIPQLKIICETIAVNLNNFLNHGYDIEKLTLVGHSLGAQCIGLIGRHLRSISNGKYVIPRLYGLDPAGPGFEVANWMTLFGVGFDSISSFDGKYVQIIHTNAGTLGIQESRGHVDFYPNGGQFQPGCEDDTIPQACYHSRAWQLFQESVRTEKVFVAQKCDSFSNFKNSSCHNERTFMGYGGKEEKRGKFYLRTHRNVYRMSLGNVESLHFQQTKVCFGFTGTCEYEDEFVDRA